MQPPEMPPRATRLLSRGDLRLLVLALLAEQPRHGYELIQLVSERFARTYTPSAGTMYPLLSRFEQDGWIDAEDDGGRRRFHLTAAGRDALHARGDEVRAAEQRAYHRAREVARAAMPVPMRDAMQQLKHALIRHHGRWQAGEAERVAGHLLRAVALLEGPLGGPADPPTPPA